MDYSMLFFLVLPLVAFFYSSVGHGGASGYLALMVFWSFPAHEMKQTALILNLFVAGIAFVQFYKAGHFKPNIFLWFAIGSVPAAFLGGTIDLDPLWYKRILGGLLLFAVWRMLFSADHEKTKSMSKGIGVVSGAGIGFFSGLIGIGGGIILTPLLVLTRWANVKEAAAVSAAFIWVNSLSGLLGQWTVGITPSKHIAAMIALALAGGFAGSYLGSFQWERKRLQQLLAVVLAMASCKLMTV